MKEYCSFEEFYSDGCEIVQKIKSKTIGFYAVQRVKFARKHVRDDILNSYIKIGILNNKAIKKLNSLNNILKFSMDNLIKNLISHSEIRYDDYIKIELIAKNPSKIIKSKTDYDIMLLKSENKYYKLIIKTTKNRNENFVKSFHLIKQERYKKYKE